jgi:TrmH family RNA methyltransferase
MKRIASADNPKYKSLVKLAQNVRERKRRDKALLDGVHLVAAYRDYCGKPEFIAVSDSGLKNLEIHVLLESLKPLEPIVLSDVLFKRLSTVKTPTGIIATIAKLEPTSSRQNETCIMLEDIQDAGNLGSILRSAAAAGVKEVFLSRDSVDAWSPRVLRASMGAHFLLNIYENSDLVEIKRSFKGKVMTTTQKASLSLFDVDLRGLVAFVFGNEGNGLSPEMLSAADEAIAIPMAHNIESLNVAAVAAICLFERTRQLR